MFISTSPVPDRRSGKNDLISYVPLELPAGQTRAAGIFSNLSSSWLLLQRHPGGNANASHGEATYSQVPRDGRRPSVHDLPCEASRSAKMGEGRSDRNLYAHGGAARRRNQGGDRGSAPTLGSKCRDLPGRPGEARAVGPDLVPVKFPGENFRETIRNSLNKSL